MKKLTERLLMCWYALTKKNYAAFYYDRLTPGKSGARCLINVSKAGQKIFFSSIIGTLEQIEPDCRTSEKEEE